MKRGISSISYKIDGKDIGIPLEVENITYTANAEDRTQPSIEGTELTFVREANDFIRQWIEDGKNGGPGIFEGPDYQVVQQDLVDSLTAFDGFMDLTQFRAVDFARCTVPITYIQGRGNFDELARELTYGYLYDINVITNSDFAQMPFVVETRRNFTEVALAFFMFYELSKELADGIQRIGEQTANIAAAAAQLPNGSIVAVILAAALLALEVAFAAIIITLLVNMITDTIQTFFPALSFHKCISLKKLLEKGLNFLGYELETNLPLSEEFYVPSNLEAATQQPLVDLSIKPKGVEIGIPKVTEEAYTLGGALELIRKRFNADYIIKNNTVFLYTEDDPFFTQQSSFTMPDTQQTEAFTYNTDDLVNTRVVEFLYDTSDQFTIDNFTGTTYQVTSIPINIINPKKNGIKGTEINTIPVALATRKDSLSNLEEAMLDVAQAAEDLLAFFGSNQNFTSRIKARVGAAKVSSEFHAVPKLVKLVGGSIPFNHRNTLSARAAYENYYFRRSFIDNNSRRQRKVYSSITIPFSFANLVEVSENTYFTDQEGRLGKIQNLQYNPYAGSAVVDYWVEEIYYTNLKEIKIEP